MIKVRNQRWSSWQFWRARIPFERLPDVHLRTPVRKAGAVVVGLVLVYILFGPINVSEGARKCAALDSSHRKILSTLRRLSRIEQHGGFEELRATPVLPDAENAKQAVLLNRLRQASTRYLRKLKSWSCPMPPLTGEQVRNLEFSLSSRYKTDGVLLYLLSIFGSVRREFVEIDCAHGRGIFGAATLFTSAYNWTLYGMYESWTGYEHARRMYESESGTKERATIIDAGRVFKRLDELTKTFAFGGTNVDVMALFPDYGDELLIVPHLARSWIRPRFLLVLYQDYWGPQVNRWRTVDESEQHQMKSDGVDRARFRLFAGGSISTLIRMANRKGYRLVWCLGSAPIAIFASVDTAPESVRGENAHIQTLSDSACIDRRIYYPRSETWFLDAEAMWDDAQAYKWHTT